MSSESAKAKRMTLTEFLLARFYEDEASARRIFDLLPAGREMGMGPLEPARVLAECEAKRRLVDWLTPVDVGSEGWYAARLLALPYAAHPDYRDEWKP